MKRMSSGWLCTIAVLIGGIRIARAVPVQGVEMIGVVDGSGRLLEGHYTGSALYGLTDFTAESRLPIAATGVAFAEDDDGGLQVMAWNDGRLLHTIRARDGSYQWQGWGDVNATVGNVGGAVKKVAMCSLSGEMHVLVVTYGNALSHTIRRRDGSWSNWGSVPAAAGYRGPIVDVSCASNDPESQLQVAIVTQDGRLWHSIRSSPSGTWTQFADVAAAAGSSLRGFTHVGMTQDFTRMQLMASTSDGRLWHTIRDQFGTWQFLGDVFGANGGPIPDGGFDVREISATIGQPGAMFSIVKWSGIPWGTTRRGDGTWSGFYSWRASFNSIDNFVCWPLGYYY